MKYIYQHKGWPHFTWDNELLMTNLSKVRHMQGSLIGKMMALGFPLKEEALLETLTLDVVKSTAIEGEVLNVEQVRSSIARRLGIEIAGLVKADRHVDGVVQMMLDATQGFEKKISKQRLFDWHAALFPTGRSGMHKIIVGNWRNDSDGPMQVVSGPMGKEKVHYQAPDSKKVSSEMSGFVKWFNTENTLEPVLKAGLAHLWFITIHPFEDGNGRIARALTDMLLARADGSSQRFYSMSAQILRERNKYYDMLEATQKNDLDITKWLNWFLECLISALSSTEDTLKQVFAKAQFWKTHANTIFNERQRTMLNRLFDNFEGNLTSSKWAKMNKCSADTALRDIQDLLNKDVLQKVPGGGRNTSYEVKMD